MNDEPTTGSLDTNVRLLAQRVATAEIHLNRLGDSVRTQSDNLSKIAAQVSKKDDFLDYRIEQMEKNQKQTSDRYWGVVAGLAITILITVFEIIFTRR